MKRFLTHCATLILFASAFHAAAIAQTAPFTSTDPGEYSNYIVQEQERLAKEFLGFSQFLQSGADEKSCEDRRIEVAGKIEIGLRRVKDMLPFKNNDKLRQEAVAVFELYRDLHDNEFAKLATTASTHTSSIAEMERYFGALVVAETKMRDYTQRLATAQGKFAKDNGLTYAPSANLKQFDHILDANIYTHEVHYEYLTVARHNEIWWDYMQKGNVAAMEKVCEDIAIAAAACKLGAMPGFDGSTELRDIAKSRVTFYLGLSKKEYHEIALILGNPATGEPEINRLNEIIDSYDQYNQDQNYAFTMAGIELIRKATNL